MSRISSADTSLELKVRRYLYAEGYRYRKRSNLRGRPDIVFPGRRIAVFVNGCFWHMHGCRLSSIPSARRDFWEAKLAENRARDMENRTALEREGWTVVTIWECEVEKNLETSLEPLMKLLSLR